MAITASSSAADIKPAFYSTRPRSHDEDVDLRKYDDVKTSAAEIYEVLKNQGGRQRAARLSHLARRTHGVV